MSLIKLNNNAVKNVSSLASASTGDLVFISKQTASSSASISFTSGIDSTYKEYIFYFVNIRPASDNVRVQFNLSTDGGSNYNVTKTTTDFSAQHNESGSFTNLTYSSGRDLAQSTGYQALNGDGEVSSDSDHGLNGKLNLFNPSSTTFAKHFIGTTNYNEASNYSINAFIAGYGNTTSAINAVSFNCSSGNIDSGEILLYGVN